jgi:glycerol-3-phosphate dehydrogenase
MRPELNALGSIRHDLLVIGGGILGACLAWDAVLRGLTVALVERGEFGGATSANSLRIVHGGLRYLARSDLTRMRESVQERSTLLRIAPGLVHPLPVAIPTGSPGYPRRVPLRLALALNDLLSAGRNRHLDPTHHLPPGRLLSPRELGHLCPGLGPLAQRGGALWYDARLSCPEQLTRAFVRSATERGAVAADYACAERFTSRGGRVLSVAIKDCHSGAWQDVAAAEVVVAAGPWTHEVLTQAAGTDPELRAEPRHALALNLVLRRRLATAAIGVRSERPAAEDPIGGGRRFLFLAPQDETTLLGTWYGVAGRGDLEARLEQGSHMLLEDVNRACPELGLTPADVVGRQWGHLPVEAGRDGRPGGLADRPLLRGPEESGLKNLHGAETVKYTTARAVAERVIDGVVARLPGRYEPSRSATVPLTGAGLEPATEGVR